MQLVKLTYENRKKHKKAIARYLKDESIDFKKEEDLKKLLVFFSQLS